jgi:cell division protein FtsB
VKKVHSQGEEIGQLKLANIELTKKGDAQRREIEALTMNDERLEKRVTELNNCNDELEKKNENLTATVTRMDAHIKDDINSIKRVHTSNPLLHSLLTCFSKLTLALTPLHLRVLLDSSRKKVLQLLRYESWEHLRGGQTIAQLLLALQNNPALTNVQYPLSISDLEFLCCFNNVRRDGNAAAHTATKEEVRDAVQQKPLDKKERISLEQLFAFTYEEHI